MLQREELLVAAEAVAVVLNLGFTLLIAYERRTGWLLGFVAALLSIGLYALTRTWALCALNVYYTVMAAYGWWSWGADADTPPIRRAPARLNLTLIAACIAGTAVVGLTLRGWLNGTFPLVDAFVGVFSLAATWLMTRKYIDNWVWFIVADAVGIWLNWRIGYQLYAGQYVVYIALSIAGLLRWRKALAPPPG